MPRDDLIQLRRDTPEDWAAANPVLEDGEPGWDGSTLKIGDGVSPWSDLDGIGASDFSDPAVAALLTEGTATHAALVALVELQQAGLVADDDPRLADARTPLEHTHTPDEVTGLVARLDGVDDDLTAEGEARAAGDALALPKAGGTMTGPLTLAGAPSNALHAATRQYVLDKVAELTGLAPADLDTFVEVAQRINAGDTALTALAGVVAGKQPLDGTLTALAGLTTTPYGRALLSLLDAPAARTALALGTAATHAHGDYEPAGSVAAEAAVRAAADLALAGQVTDSAVASQVTSGTTTKAALNAAYARNADNGTGFVLDSPTETTTPTVYPIGAIDGVPYGRHATTGGLYKSTDDGATWTLVTAAATGYSIHKLGNGEVLLNGGATLYRSTGWASNPATATWAACATANGTSSFIASCIDTYGNYVLIAEYAVPRTDARYVKVSTDNGVTFTTVRDLNALYPGQEAETHWHAVTIDPWSGGANPRLWVSHGDGPRGVFYSDDNGSNWTTYATDWQPMPLMATPNGIVTSTDQPSPDGVWLIPRDLSAKQLLAKIPAPFWQGSLLGFGHAATRDPVTGMVAILFRADQQTYFTESNKAVVLMTDGVRADLVYRTVQGGSVGVAGSTNWDALPVITTNGYFLASYLNGATRYTIKGRIRRGVKTAQQRDPGNALTGSAAGRTSIGIGYGTAPANQSVFVGTKAVTGTPATDEAVVLVGEEATGSHRATAVGFQAQALLTYSVAVGYTAQASGAETVSVGAQSIASGTTSTAVGRSAQATGVNAVAVGKDAQATAQGATAFGAGSRASTQSAVGIGGVAKGGYGAIAIGDYLTESNGASSVAIGEGSQVKNGASTVAYGVAVGAGALVKAQGGVALGRTADAQGTESVALGYGTVTPGSYSVGIGYRNIEITKFQTGSDPVAPGANKGRLYIRDNGSGKMQLCARFPTGAVQVIATEP